LKVLTLVVAFKECWLKIRFVTNFKGFDWYRAINQNYF